MRASLKYWRSFPRKPEAEDIATHGDLDRLVVDETVAAFGVISAFARWGDTDRLSTALDKLDAIREMLVRDTDKNSWLLAKLTAAYAQDFVTSSLRTLLTPWPPQMTADGQQALERYIRDAYLKGRCQAWPSQQAGIARLQAPGSFALCTPTGSGKTSIAELAILQTLFAAHDRADSAEPIAIYLVPSRALAAEIEGKLSRVFKRLSRKKVIVTGLYGGTDWGPADAWLNAPDPSVLICTYEKGEALLRFLGPHFVSRVGLAILDEAHSVRFNGNIDNLRTANCRAFRLESLGLRLIRILKQNSARVIALSAVATGIEAPLQRWVTGSESSNPVKVDYRSTRQLIGRLIVSTSGHYETRYDLLDRMPLEVVRSGANPTLAFVANPAPPCPPAKGWDGKGPLKSLRPAALWAAMHLTRDAKGAARGVLVSLTERPGDFAKDCLTLLTKTWASLSLPNYFRVPDNQVEAGLYSDCKAACADIFGSDSVEYRLLEKGIALHHGRMPPSLGRLLVALVDAGISNLVIATSTLSEGVNLPLKTVIIPSITRAGRVIQAGEFANIAGRAGGPGVRGADKTS